MEETTQQLMNIDPKNVFIKNQYLKVLLEKNDVWKAVTEYMRTRSLCEKKLVDTPESPILLDMLSELEQTSFSIRIKSKEAGKECPNLLAISGDGEYGSLGIGKFEDCPRGFMQLPELTNKKIQSVACGDSHTLVVVTGKTAKKGEVLSEYDSSSDIIAFGANSFGQVNGIPSDSVTEPKIVAHFIGKKVKFVAASRSRSVAVDTDNQIYEWGYQNDPDRPQFYCYEDFKDSEIVDVKLGLTFMLVLTSDGRVHYNGEITQEGAHVIDSFGRFECFNEKMGKKDLYVPSYAKDFWKEQKASSGESTENESFTFVKIEAGYSHAMLLDDSGRAFMFGAGIYGQLGLGFEIQKSKLPLSLDEVNYSGDKIEVIGCGSNLSYVITELGLMYIWGMVVDGDPTSIAFYPTIFGLPDESPIISVKAGSRRVVACDARGEIYKCELDSRRRLEQVEEHKVPLFTARKVLLGKNMEILLDSVIDPTKTKILSHDCEMETLLEGNIEIRFHDVFGDPFGLTATDEFDTVREMLESGMIKVIFTQNGILPQTYDWSKVKGMKTEEKKEEDLDKRPKKVSTKGKKGKAKKTSKPVEEVKEESLEDIPVDESI